MGLSSNGNPSQARAGPKKMSSQSKGPLLSVNRTVLAGFAVYAQTENIPGKNDLALIYLVVFAAVFEEVI